MLAAGGGTTCHKRIGIITVQKIDNMYNSSIWYEYATYSYNLGLQFSITIIEFIYSGFTNPWGI